jgi:ERCC4-type nuclease
MPLYRPLAYLSPFETKLVTFSFVFDCQIQNNFPFTNEISQQSVSSKLVLLTIHFSKLRILWCSSPSEAAELFEELKANYPQPNAQTAMAIRTDQIGAEVESKYNPILKVETIRKALTFHRLLKN